MTLPSLDRVTDRALAADVRLVDEDAAPTLRVVVQATYLLVSGTTSIVQADELDDEAVRWLEAGASPEGAAVVVTGAGASRVTTAGEEVHLDPRGRGDRLVTSAALRPGAEVAVETADAGTVATRLPDEAPVAWVERGASRRGLALRPLLLRVDLVGLRLSIVWCARAPLDARAEGVRVVLDVRGAPTRRDGAPPEWDVDNTVSIDGTAPPSLPLPFVDAGRSPATPLPAGARPQGDAAASAAPRVAPRDGAPPLMLLHVEPGTSARLRRIPRWRPVLQEPSHAGRRAAEEAGDDATLAGDARDAVAVLRGAATTPLGALGAALAAGVEDGLLVAPLVVVDGELELLLDGGDVLRAMVEAATPLRSLDPRVEDAVARARPFAEAPWLDAEVADAERGRLREVVASLAQGRDARSLDAQVERKLRRDRKHLTRSWRGAPWVAAELVVADARATVLVPRAAVDVAPVARRFPARLLVEVRPAIDPEDQRGVTLFLLALARDVGVDVGAERSP